MVLGYLLVLSHNMKISELYEERIAAMIQWKKEKIEE